MTKRSLMMAGVSLTVFAADQVSKFMMVRRLADGQRVPMIEGFFNLTLTYNKGIAFGGGASLPEPLRQILICVLTLLALGIIVYVLMRLYPEDWVAKAALAAIIGGAAGNIADRLRLGAVVDFLDVYYHAYHWPAFNLADSAVCIGVGVLLLRPAGRRQKDAIQESAGA